MSHTINHTPLPWLNKDGFITNYAGNCIAATFCSLLIPVHEKRINTRIVQEAPVMLSLLDRILEELDMLRAEGFEQPDWAEDVRAVFARIAATEEE